MTTYKALNEVTKNDLDEMKMQAQKALSKASPNAYVTVPVEAGKLLWLLEKFESRAH